MAQSLNNLANLYKAQGKYEEALQQHFKALKIREKLLGDDHPDCAETLYNLANLFRLQGKDNEAIQNY